VLNYSTDKSNDRVWGLSASAWVQIGLISLTMFALFRFNLVRLWGKTNPINGQDPNWQHAIFVPLIGLYYLYIHREELLAAAVAPRQRELGIRVLAAVGLAVVAAVGAALASAGELGTPMILLGAAAAGLALAVAIPTATVLGAATLAQGLLVFAYGIWPGQNDYLKDLGMVITLFGVVTLLCGWAVMRVAWFPIVFLVVALPWPELVYSKLAWPLQKLAASAAVGTLRVCGVVAQNIETKITMFGQGGKPRVLNVAEACAGLKSVMTFLMVAGTVAFLGSRPLWEKVVLTLSAVPIAIFCNVLRVAGQGLLDFYWSHEVSEGFAHQFVGLIMLIPGFFMIMGLGWVLEKLFIEEVDRRQLGAAGAGAAAVAAVGAKPASLRGKRMIVEVPRKASVGSTENPVTAGPVEANAPAPVAKAPAVVADEPFPSAADVMPIAAPGVPAVSTPPVPPRTPKPISAPPAIAPRTVSPAAAAPAAKPVARPAVVGGPAVAPVARPAVAAKPAASPTAPPSSLKAPTVRPAGAVAPVGGSALKPSSKPAAPRPIAPPPAGLKPAAPAAGVARPAVPPQGLKPATPRPAPAGTAAAGSTAPVARPKPAIPQQQQQQQQQQQASSRAVPPRQGGEAK
jgi:exosortase